MIIIKQAVVYAPKYLGIQDILISEGKIIKIAPQIDIKGIETTIIDGTEHVVMPGIIDQHVHVTGGGGEGGFKTRVPEAMLTDFIKGGVTTVVGLLGTDGATRSVEQLVAKVNALNEEGINAYALTGSYRYPSPTITGDIQKDIVFIDPIIGLKIALSDHRSSMIDGKKLAHIASEARIAGMIASKSGHVVCHMGDDEQGMKPIFEALKKSALPISVLRPTHVNRRDELLEEAQTFLEMGGTIDLTCGLSGHKKPGEIIKKWMGEGVKLNRVTISSDGFGSWSSYDQDGHLIKMGVSRVDAMFEELKDLVIKGKVSLDKALPFFTSNVASALNLQHKKGRVEVSFDADLLIVDRHFQLDTVIAKGQVMMQNKQIIVKGTYEN